MTLPSDATRQPSEKVLYTFEIDQSLLAHNCHEAVEALVFLCSFNLSAQATGNEHWASLLTPISEQLDMLCILNDHKVERAQLHLVVNDQDLPVGNRRIDPHQPSARLQADRKAAKRARKALRKTHQKNRQEPLTPAKA